MKRVCVCLLSVIAIGGQSAGGVLRSPTLTTMVVGTETEDYRWQGGDPFVEGAYGSSGDSYTLTGNGHGVYWCQDGAAFAYVNEPPLCGSFTFTARIREAPLLPAGVGQIGIMVKGRIGTLEPVLSLRWDTYWAGASGSGLAWFNRITPTKDMMSIDNAPAEKSCHGTGQGCLGGGLENHLSGYPQLEGLWLRIRREVVDGASKYYLYARRSASEEWEQFPSVAGTHNACGSDPLIFAPSMRLPTFMVPEDRHGRVYAGLFVAHGSFGGKSISAVFDSITIEADNIGAKAPRLANTFPPNTVWWPSFFGPNGNYTVPDDDLTLVDILRDALPVWRSGPTPHAKGPGSSGGASPIVYNGRVFLYYYLPIGDPETATNATDHAVAFDAVTGQELWRKDLGGTGRYVAGKTIISNHTMCARGDKVYAVGCGGRLYCLDAATGTTLWTGSAGGVPFTSGLVIAGRALVCAIGGNRNSGRPASVVAVDTATGANLWKCDQCTGGGATPSLWTHKGQEYIVVADTAGKVRCLEPGTGAERWNVAGAGFNRWTVRVSEDYMVVNMGPMDTGRVGAYRITPESATKVWELPTANGYIETGLIYKGYLYYSPDNRSNGYYQVRMSDGEIVAAIGNGSLGSSYGMGMAGGYSFGVNGRLIWNQKEGHKPVQLVMHTAAPFAFTDPSFWVPPNLQTCTYSENRVGMAKPYVNGRLFIRGFDAIYCYDLRWQLYCGGSTALTGGGAPGRSRQVTFSAESRRIVAGDGPRRVTLVGLNGRTVRSAVVGTAGAINVSTDAPGIYLLSVETASGSSTRRVMLP